MAKTLKCIEVRTGQGTLIFSLNLIERELEHESQPGNPTSKQPEHRQERSQTGNASNGDALITDAQKRYLFRILADQGIEKERAYQYLKENFGVQILKEVSKSEASRMIKQLLGESEGGNGDGPPF